MVHAGKFCKNQLTACSLIASITSRVRQLGLRRRGCRGGGWQRSPPVLRPVGNGTYTVASSHTLAHWSVVGSRRSALIRYFGTLTL